MRRVLRLSCISMVRAASCHGYGRDRHVARTKYRHAPCHHHCVVPCRDSWIVMVPEVAGLDNLPNV